MRPEMSGAAPFALASPWTTTPLPQLALAVSPPRMSVREPAMVKIRSDKIGENSAVGARSERPRNHDYLCTVIVL